ncbi:hypothetical protein T440DRAFT_471981 [Plenodomus tracheiphilus IPT5]|uniref:Uncharacterized protein n=1 Tax=Plenodomus tracheiphilus IPT5 TaxID=1408161 RepID=A0A6A7AW38_9PLEO|nr:hypothetical protein T440DRAFT_471981 [Plenodomus tracheiphilus IPT5]
MPSISPSVIHLRAATRPAAHCPSPALTLHALWLVLVIVAAARPRSVCRVALSAFLAEGVWWQLRHSSRLASTQ